jgi:peptide methionine sulfoxide reductase MsrB
MIKNNESVVIITTRNKKYCEKLGYICKVGEILSIDINKMPKMSHNKVIAICEICKNESELPFSKYNNNKDRHGFYSCKKCSNIKRKRTNIEIYGVENICQLDEIRYINKKWMSSDEFKIKSEKTLIRKYGVNHYSKTDKFKTDFSNKMKEVIKEKKENGIYNCFLSLCENKELREKGMFDKYGATYSFQVPEIKKKIQESNLEKFGHISPFGNLDIQNKIKENIL